MVSDDWAPPKRGVGIVYNPALHDFLVRNASTIDVVEIEPQTAWTAVDPVLGPFRQIEAVTSRWHDLPQTKLIHSVGMPLAGTRPPSPAQIEVLAPLARSFGCTYVSEHLSVGGTPHENAGFLLPPCQSDAGVEQAVRNIRTLSAALGLPIAIETGVSYLPPFPGEILDGDFVRAVAEAADCGILLDIHNIYCNERNGRQRLLEFVDSLPPERVWEMHVAGGLEMDGYWLDAHSGKMPDDLVQVAKDVASALPNLSAVIFEVFPSYLRDGSERMLQESLDQAREVWSASGKSAGPALTVNRKLVRRLGEAVATVEDWEAKLTRSIRMQVPVGLGDDLSLVPPMALYSRMSHSFRASALARLLPRTLYLIEASRIDVEPVIQRYEMDTAAPLFALNEARGFVDWCAGQGIGSRLVEAVARYELALLQVPLEGEPIVVAFDGDPRPLFQAIADQRLPPSDLSGPPWEIEITPDEAGGPTLSPMGS